MGSYMLGLGLDVSNRNEKKDAPVLSVIAPIFNESGNIAPLVERLSKSAAQVSDNYELIFVDDGSRDDSAPQIERFAQSNPRIKLISFSRNFGHQVAITAGMEFATGQAIVIIDADLQDPPELIPDMVKKWKEGFEVVYAVRGDRDGESLVKKITAAGFYRLLKHLTEFDIPVDTGDFRLMDRRVVEAFLAMPERGRYIRGMISWVGFKQTGISYHRAARTDGKTKFTMRKMIRFALEGITSFSYVPLHLASVLGVACAGISGLILIYVVLSNLLNNQVVRGWTSIMGVIIFLGGIQLLMIGVLGEYIGRLVTEQKRRPLYIVNKKTNL